MNAEIKKKWLEALQSGEYKQGKRSLREGDNFCCLGVLCNIITPDKWERDGWLPDGARSCTKWTLPGNVMNAAGLERTDPYIKFNGGFQTLTCLNDDEGLTFPQLADLIEEQL